MNKLDMQSLINFYTDKLISLGLEHKRAFRLAKAQVEVHAFGIETHGLQPMNVMIKDIIENPEKIKTPQILNEFGGIVTADCSRTPNTEPILWGMDKAAELASIHGIGFISLLNGGWVGTMGYHLSNWAKKGYLMMAWNQLSNLALVSPFGGKQARFNTNPMAFSFPLGDKSYIDKPLIADFSTSAISYGKTNLMIKENTQAVENIYQDKNGKPTRDPNTVKDNGTILPFGGENFGFRGTALALLIEAMTAIAGSIPVNKDNKGGQNTHIFALNINALGNIQGYNNLMEDLMNWVLDSEPTSSEQNVRYPGQRGWNLLKNSYAQGVTLSKELMDQLYKLGFV